MMRLNIKNRKRFDFLLLILFTVITSLIFIMLPHRIYLGIKNITPGNDISIQENTLPKEYPYNDIVAPSYIIYDNTNKKIIIEKDNTQRPLASVTKLMTALIALGNCQDIVNFDGKEMKKEAAVEEMLVESSNEIAEAIANICPNTDDFVGNMNLASRDMGLGMSFANPSGLDQNNETESSAFGSPLDVAILINKLYMQYPKILEATSYSIFNGVKNTNTYASNWPFLLGSKTGFTDVAHGNLAILFEPIPNKRISIVVLGSTKEDRFTDVQKLMNWYLKRR